MYDIGTLKLNVKTDTKEIDGLESKLSGLSSKATKLVAAAGAAVGAAIGATAKKAIDAVSSFEQLSGGVEKLFGSSANTVKKYANNAFKTVQMSANEYMTLATEFSASMINSLGGDTEKAAEQVNKAITQMQDNASIMGTDIEMIKTAYKGFARESYLALDNLKLGYAGTKEGMQQLLADAEKISGIHFDISSYSDVVDAIQVIQENMGIAGNAAKEASTTIEGLANTLKSKWSNSLTEVGGKLEGLTKGALTKMQQIIDSVDKALTKINIDRVTASLQKSLNTIIDRASRFIELKLPAIIEGIANAIAFVTDNLDYLLPIAEGVLTSLLAYKAAETVINGVSTAMSLLGVASSAALGPIGLAIAAITGGIVALESYSKANYEAMSALNEVEEGSSTMAKKVSDFDTKIRESSKSMSEQRAELIKTHDAQKTYTRDFEDLYSSYLKNKTGSTQLKSAISDLNNQFPGLNLNLDETNGHLNRSVGEIEDIIEKQQELENFSQYVEEYKTREEELAEAEEVLAEAKEQHLQAERNLRQAQAEAYADAQRHVDMNGNLVEVENEYTIALQNAKDAELQARNARNLAQADYDALNSKVQEYVNNIIGSSNEMKVWYSQSEANRQKAEQFANSLIALDEAYAANGEAIQKSITDMMSHYGIFDEIQQKSDQTVTKSREVIASNTTQLQTYQTDVQHVLENTDKDFGGALAYLTETFGPENSKFWSELAEMPTTELESYLTDVQGYLEVKDSVASSITGSYSSLGERVRTTMQNKFSYGNGLSDASPYVQGISDAVNNALNAAWRAYQNMPSYARPHKTGLDYVPYDGYLATLHLGERVLTRSENERYTNGEERFTNEGGNQITYNIVVPDNPNALETALTLRDLTMREQYAYS